MNLRDPLAGIGTFVAVLISWHLNHSILWAIIHGLCNWFYVVYWFIVLHNGIGLM